MNTAINPTHIQTNGHDFPDWMNPFLVKELRAGLRSGVFVASFVVLQLGLALVVGLQAFSAGDGATIPASTWPVAFWIAVILRRS